MLTSKERAQLPSQATTLDTTLMVGKGGVTDAVIAEAETSTIAKACATEDVFFEVMQ